MRFSKKTSFAPRILMDLARYNTHGPVQTGEMSLRQGISVKYLEQLIKPLRQAGLVTSVRGPKGGHVLVRNLEETTLGQIVRLMDGEVSFAACEEAPDAEAQQDGSRVEQACLQAARIMFECLDSISLADLFGLQSGQGQDEEDAE